MTTRSRGGTVARRARASWLALAFLAGCTEAPQPVPPAEEDAPAVVPTGPPTPVLPDDQALLRRPKLPDDVFFDDPLAIASNRTRIPGAGSPPDTPASTEEKPADGVTEPPAVPQATDWAALLPADLLVAEVSRIRERFAPKLASVATFNNSLLDFPPYAAELAALAGIAAEHSGAIPWKSNAKHVRDLAGEMLADELQRGQKSYEQVKGPFDTIATLLDGKRPGDLPERDDATDFALVADFSYLMRRVEMGENALKTNGGSAGALTKNAGELVREARVLAALSKVVAREEYGYGDDAKFQGFATAMTEAALSAAGAAESEDFAAFDAARSALGQSCVKCHGDYRNN